MDEPVYGLIAAYIILGGLIIAMRRDYVVTFRGMDIDKATAQSILIWPVWPAWIAYTIVRGLVIGLWWVCKNAFKKEN